MRFSEWMEEEDVEKWLDSLSEEELIEAMSVSYDYKDTTKSIIGSWTFRSKKDKGYEVTASKISKDVYHVVFYYVDKEGRRITMLTNFNDSPTAILNSVYNIMEKEIIQKYSPKEIRFEAHGDKRQRAYEVVLRRYINDRMKKYGYELQVEQHEDLPLKIYRYIKGEQHNG
jgi:hypothetical protein